MKNSKSQTCLENTIIENQFLIQKQVAKGKFAIVFDCKDLNSTDDEILVIKISDEFDMTLREVALLNKLQKTKCSNKFPKVFANGEFKIDEIDNKLYYIVMSKFKITLEQHIQNVQKTFDLNTLLQFGIQLVELLQCVHEVGFIYNDIKLDNIMIGSQSTESSDVKLIDFGLAKKYRDPNGNHIKSTKQKYFSGNRIFASANQMNCKSVSRKDDLISVYYLLVYLIDGDLPFLSQIKGNNYLDKQSFQIIQGYKNVLTPEQLCGSTLSKVLIPFIQAIENLDCEEEPNYNYLKFKLINLLLDQDEVPHKNIFYKQQKPIVCQQNDKDLEPLEVADEFNEESASYLQLQDTTTKYCSKTNNNKNIFQ